MTVGVDFDHTLTDIRIQSFIKALVKDGHTVWVITARNRSGCQEPFFLSILDKVGINGMQVIYTDDKPKWEWLNDMSFDIFIDNDKRHVIDAAVYTKCIPLQFINQL